MKPEQSLLSAAVLLTLLPGCFGQAPCREFGNYETELAAMRENAMDWVEWEGTCEVLTMVAGECNQGRTLFLYTWAIDYGTTMFFESATGDFLGYSTKAGHFNPICLFLDWYYLYPIQCRDGIVTEVLCGTTYQVGDPFL